MNKKIDELKIDNYFSEAELQFLNEIEKIEKISPQEEIELVKKAQSGDMEARNKLVKANLRMVANMASKYLDRGVEFLDLIQEGSIGLIKSINKFDTSRSNNFKGFAHFDVSNSLGRAVKQSEMIRRPENIVDAFAKAERITNALRMELHREPTREEIAREMGISLKRTEELLLSSKEIDSLDRPIEGEDIHTLLDTISSDDNYYEEIENIIVRKELVDTIDKFVERYPSQKVGIEILKKHCGFDGEEPKTYEEIGKEFNCSKTAAHAKETKAALKLRFYSNAKNRISK